ncbi:MAG: hypothetical protein AAF226_19095, partial [Verrucomicrobiota bacterium]
TPASVIEGWPGVVNEAVASSRKIIRIKPGESSLTVATACIMEPEATIALITLDVGLGVSSEVPVQLGDCYADDVQLSLMTLPKLPVKVKP